jgi:farnesyl diphosphate synthase
MTDFSPQLLPLDHWQAQQLPRVEAAMTAALTPSPLRDAMRYATTGGKRLRALLVYAAAELFPGAVNVDAPAAAVEFIHAYSLIHDDLPCMEDDALRRGQPSCHVAFGEATALLAGDALQALAFEVLAQADLPQPALAVAVLARASGADGMCGGQALDLAGEGKSLSVNELEQIHRKKTGALITASVLLGAMSAAPLTAEQRQKLELFGEKIGLAFQCADDILDVEAASDTLGKTAGKDEKQQKVTYVSLFGVDEARRLMQGLHDDAVAALDGFGARADRLRDLANLMITRRK